jgi:hypothetical protein
MGFRGIKNNNNKNYQLYFISSKIIQFCLLHHSTDGEKKALQFQIPGVYYFFM